MRNLTAALTASLLVVLCASTSSASDISLEWDSTGSNELEPFVGIETLSVLVSADFAGISSVSLSLQAYGDVRFSEMVTDGSGHQECISPPNPISGVCFAGGAFLFPSNLGVGPPAPTDQTVRAIEAGTLAFGPVDGTFTLAGAFVEVSGPGGVNAFFFDGSEGVVDNSSTDVTALTNIVNAVVLGEAPRLGFNIDFGFHDGPPAASYAAAGGQVGPWNEIGNGTSALTDTSAASTGATVSVSATSDSGFFGPAPSDDDGFLLFDNFFSNNGTTWNVNLAGLENGTYRLYLYAPSDDLVPSGDMLVNGVAVASIPGDDRGNLILGTSLVRVDATPNAGAIAISGAGASFSGLSGMQVVPIPEPSQLSMLLPGIALLSGLSRRRRARQGRAGWLGRLRLASVRRR